MDKSEQRKTITLFFCDIYGTVDGNFTEEETVKFAGLLEELRRQNNSDYLVFSILSSELPVVVNSYKKHLSKYFSDSVIVMPEFLELEKVREEKIAYALCCVEQLKKVYDIDTIIYADDIVFLHEMLGELLSEKEDILINSIVPGYGENNLNFINNELERKIIKSKPQKR